MDLTTLRKSNKLSARKVYTKLKIDKTTFKNLEEGKTSMKAEWLPVMASMYGISKETLLEIYLSERWLRSDKKRKGSN